MTLCCSHAETERMHEMPGWLCVPAERQTLAQSSTALTDPFAAVSHCHSAAAATCACTGRFFPDLAPAGTAAARQCMASNRRRRPRCLRRPKCPETRRPGHPRSQASSCCLHWRLHAALALSTAPFWISGMKPLLAPLELSALIHLRQEGCTFAIRGCVSVPAAVPRYTICNMQRKTG